MPLRGVADRSTGSRPSVAHGYFLLHSVRNRGGGLPGFGSVLPVATASALRDGGSRDDERTSGGCLARGKPVGSTPCADRERRTAPGRALECGFRPLRLVGH